MPRLSTIQSVVPIADDLARRLNNELLAVRPELKLRLYTNGHHLRFLRHMPDLQNISIDCMEGIENLEGLYDLPRLLKVRIGVYNLTDFGFLERLPGSLESLGLQETRSQRPSLSPIKRFSELKHLWLCGQQKHIEVVGQLPRLRHLNLTSVSSASLEFLEGCTIRSLRMMLGSAKDISVLTQLSNLECLELNWVKGLAALGPVSELTGLRCMRLELLKHITNLPDLSKLANLRRLVLIQINSLNALDQVRQAQNLEEFLYSPGKIFPVHDFDFLFEMPRLKRASVGFRNLANNEAFRAAASARGLATNWVEQDFAPGETW